MKKITSLLLALALLLTLSTSAFAAAHPFTDVPSNKWYAKFVQYVYENNLMSGTSATTFSPNSPMTRGMVVTVLYRIAGSPETSGEHPFVDVASGKWYETPIAWAYENSIVSGTGATTFAPNSNITREQLVAIMFNYAKSCGYDVSNRADLSKYSDRSSIHKYAVEAFRWAVACGVISGSDATHLSPLGRATRAECAAILKSFVSWTENLGDDDTDPTEPRPTEPAPTDPEPTEPQPTDPEATEEELEALEEAKRYLSVIPFSYLGLIGQLEYEGYSYEAAVYAADNCGADWDEQAVLKAKGYLDSQAFSAEGLYDQLIYEEFTKDEARYGVDNCGADWYEQAVLCAQEYLDYSDFTYEELYEQLLYEGFTEDEARYGVDNCGVDWDGSSSGSDVPREDLSGETYILNTNTKKFHEPGCSSANSMAEENRLEWTGNREDLIAAGYEPCGRCDP